MTSGSDPRPFTPQLLLGLIVTAVGVLFTLDNLGLTEWTRYAFRYWPSVLVAIGIVKLWESRGGGGGAFGGFAFLIVGTWLLLEQTALVRISFAELWPLLLVAFGMYLVWHGVSGPRERLARDASETVSAVAILGGVARGSNARAFRGGDLTAIMGGCELDLRHAALEGEAVLNVLAIWGGIEIRVPEDWTVDSRVVPLLGGFDDKTRAVPTAVGKRLVIRGLVLMAGVEVKN